MIAARAPAKVNLALAVGPARADGLHEVATVLQRIDLWDTIELRQSAELRVVGFDDDTLVRRALESLAAEAGVKPRWQAAIEKRIPVAAGLGGGSSDGATTLRLANESLDRPLPPARLRELARGLGADAPFFLAPGPQLGTGDGSILEPLDLPQDYVVLVLLPDGAVKESTAAVYARHQAVDGWEARFERIRRVSHDAKCPRDLTELPANELASSPLAAELTASGAFRADVSGAGPALYALYDDRAAAERAARLVGRLGRVWIAAPAWYG